MDRTYEFRQIKKEEIPTLFAMVLQRIEWMNTQGIRQWNVTGYAEAYPQAYYEEQYRCGNVFVLADAETHEILSGAVLLEEDERWSDSESALYLHNFVSKNGANGAGTMFLRFAEALAREKRKTYFRLDSAEDNEKLAGYYEKQGFVAVGACIDGPYRGVLRQKRI